MIYMDAALEPIEEVTQRIDAEYQFLPNRAGETLETKLILLTADYVLWEIVSQSWGMALATLEAFREVYGTRLVVSDGDDAQVVLSQLKDYIEDRRKDS